MNALEEAINQVKQALMEGVEPVLALAEAAQDYRLRVEFIERRFIETHKGLGLAQWREQRRTEIQRVKDMAVASRAAAIEKARNIALVKWHVTGMNADIAGRVFNINGREYAWVVYGADSANYAIRSVDLQTQRIVNFPANYFRRIMDQIAPDLPVAA